MIERNRPYPSAAELSELYSTANDARHWREHVLRIAVTVELARHRFPTATLIVDPAAGANAITARRLAGDTGIAITADLAPNAPGVGYPGTSAEQLLLRLEPSDLRRADLVILGEILEHVDAPLALLALAGAVGDGLILSTPLDEPAGVNPEHVWRWDKAGILHLLDAAGWTPTAYVELDIPVAGYDAPVRFQIHTAERTNP